MDELATLLTKTRLSATEISERTRSIYQAVLRDSRFVHSPNFERIHTDDLRLMFQAYDATFFRGAIARRMDHVPLTFRLSRRLTSSAGTTTRRTRRRLLGKTEAAFEITISTTLLFQTFQDVDRPITATGILCRNRLEALQRIFEHELMHLVEWLVWSQSNCAAQRFQSMAHGLFGHKEHTHRLITQTERAFSKFGLRVGDRVVFVHEGQQLEGILNRVTRRATVLIENPQGRRFTDGRRYVKFYVPLEKLHAARR